MSGPLKLLLKHVFVTLKRDFLPNDRILATRNFGGVMFFLCRNENISRIVKLVKTHFMFYDIKLL